MAMSGMRAFTVGVGLVDETPPKAMARQRGGKLIHRVPRTRRRGVIELGHWGFGAAGGAAFGLLPEPLRRTRWAGPAYGLVIWLGFEVVAAPLLGLSQARRARGVERVALAVDHVLYGLVLTGMPRRAPDRDAASGHL